MGRGVRGIVAGMAVLAVAAAGCSADSDKGAPAERTPAAERQDAGTLLPLSFKKLRKESFRFTSTVTMGDTKLSAEGAFDMARTVGEAEVGIGGGHDMQLRVFADDVYVQVVGRWMHLDSDRLPAEHMFGLAADPVANADYLLAVSDDVKQLGDGRYQGTLDLERYADEYADPKDAKALKKMLAKLGPEAAKVPFQATVDEQGRLTALQTTMTVVRDGEKTTVVQKSTYRDFGAEVSVKRPPADEVVEAPSGLYRD